MAQEKNNQPWQIRPDRDLLKRLEQLAERFKRETANKIAVEILRDCADIWEEAEEAKERVFLQHREKGQAIKNAMLRPLHEAEAESDQPDAQGKKGRK